MTGLDFFLYPSSVRSTAVTQSVSEKRKREQISNILQGKLCVQSVLTDSSLLSLDTGMHRPGLLFNRSLGTSLMKSVELLFPVE